MPVSEPDIACKETFLTWFGDRSLSWLDMTACRSCWNEYGEGQEAMAKLSAALKGNSTLTHLNLSENFIKPRQAASLAAVVLENTTLTSLNLSHNKIETKGAKHMGLALAKNTCVRSIFT